MEQALRIQPEEFGEAQRPGAAASENTIENVLRFANARTGEGDAKGAIGVTARDFASAIENVRNAAESVKVAEERAREADARTHTIAQRAAEELRNAEMRMQALEARARAAEGRAAEAEARASEADSWLRQIFSTISEELPARRG